MTQSALYIPSLKGIIGDWVYYTCLMNMKDVASRVSYANEIHNNKNLSDLIQRELKKGRARDISDYLISQKERFFNSLVLAVYGGDPGWFPISNLTPLDTNLDIGKLPISTKDAFGLLRFSGSEQLFAIDGQHRLSGIKKALKKNKKLCDEEVPVILVAHKKTSAGLKRTRRLFTTLNKTARPVRKGEIIALDEDDVMAIVVRKLVDENSYFTENRILYNATNNIPINNKTCLTTIGNLYDILKILYTKINPKISTKELQISRPTEQKLDNYYNIACSFFDDLKLRFPALKQFFTNANYESITQKYRGDFGGSVLFRPIGLIILLEVIAELAKSYTIKQSIQIASKLPQDITKAPYANIIWDVNRKVMINKGKTLARNLLLYMLNKYEHENRLKESYSKSLGILVKDVKLPKKINI